MKTCFPLCLGCHLNNTSLPDLQKRIKKIPLQIFQTYISNPRGMKYLPDVDPKEAIALRKAIAPKVLYIHGNLLYNLSGSTDVEDSRLNWKIDNVVRHLTIELDVGVLFDSGVVVHMGSCKNSKVGYDRMVSTIKRVLKEPSERTKEYAKLLKISEKEFITRRNLILENSSHEGTKLGYALKDIDKILWRVYEDPDILGTQINICIDTCHLFASGECDFSYESVKKLFSDIKRLRLPIEFFHFNDSCKKFDSHVDRHTCIGHGHIFNKNYSGLNIFLQNASKLQIPLLGETPSFIHCMHNMNLFQRNDKSFFEWSILNRKRFNSIKYGFDGKI